MVVQALLLLSAVIAAFVEVVYGVARTSELMLAIGCILRVCAVYWSLLAVVTLPTEPLALCSTGTNRTLKVEAVRTSSGTGVPDAGKLLSASLASAMALDGSTSARMDRLG